MITLKEEEENFIFNAKEEEKIKDKYLVLSFNM